MITSEHTIADDRASIPLLVYIAGPYRAATAFRREQNIHAARVWGVGVARCGAYPVIPHSNTSHMDGEASDLLWLQGTLALMVRCDAVVLIPGWTSSAGSREEARRAREACIPVLNADVNPDWLEPWINEVYAAKIQSRSPALWVLGRESLDEVLGLT